MTDQLTDEKPAPAPDTHPETRQGLLLPIVIPLGIFLGIGLVLFGFSRVLLSVSPAAATVIALVVAASILGVATIVASRERLSNGTLFSMIGVVAGVAMLAGGIAIVTIGTGEETGGGGGPQVVALVAPKGAAVTGFQPTTLSVAADKPIELDFTNQDPGIQHNVVIFREDPAKNPNATPVFSGDLVTGVNKATYAVPALPAGTLYFHCEVHPTTMVGTIESAVGGGGGRTRGPGRHRQGAVVRHQGDRPSGRAADDDHVPQRGRRHPAQHRHLHRRARCRRPCSRASSSRAWQRRSIRSRRSIRGRYYFHCDVHTTMNGIVVVGPPGGGSGAGGASATGATGASPSG